jgi:hypothetical protein
MRQIDRVEVYSSYAYAVEPRAFYDEGERHQVEAIERMWKSPGRLHFYLRDEFHGFYELIYDEPTDRWFLGPLGEPCRVASYSTER